MPYNGQRVYELAKEFHCSEDELIDFLKKSGVYFDNRWSVVSENT